MTNIDFDMEVIALVNARNKAMSEAKGKMLVQDLKAQYGILLATPSGKEMLAEAAEAIQSAEARYIMAEELWMQREKELMSRLEAMTAERDQFRKTAIAWQYQALKNERKTEKG